MKTDTLVTSLGRDAKRDMGSVNPLVHRTSTVIFDNFRTMRDYESGKNAHKGYGRHGTPTIVALEEAIATLEGADRAFVTSSGLSATVLALLSFLNSGDHLLVPDSMYGSTRKFVDGDLTRMGVEVEYYVPTIGADIAKHIKPNTKVVYVESPGSQTFEMQDIPAMAEVAHASGAIIISDSTWATPVLQRHFDLGIDVNIQSLTKYVAGHSDLVMGCVSACGEHVKPLNRTYLNMGLTAGADNVYLALRGLRTLMVRLRQHQESALKVATWLEQQSGVERVMYPALPSDPGHALWKRDMQGASGLFAFVMKDATEAKAEAFVDALHHFGCGYSWGGYESLITAYQPNKLRTVCEWDKDCWIIRLNIGLEAVEDLIEDLDGGFKAAAKV